MYKFVRLVLVLAFLTLSVASNDARTMEKRFSVLGLGDSITEGGKDFHSYLYPLWERLFAAGYNADFIGPRQSETRIGMIKHYGNSGKPVEFLEEHIDSVYRQYPADIVLLHAGHNHFAEQKPVDGMIRAYESIVAKILAVNPNAHIFLAQVTPSGKLPKYSYIPELNERIAVFVGNAKNKHLHLVDMATGHDFHTMTIHDLVHPNDLGAERMADRWFEAISSVFKPHRKPAHPELLTYKISKNGRSLQLHVFRTKRNKQNPTLVFFFAGGWKYGSPLQFYRECQWYQRKGYNVITADYSISTLDSSTASDSSIDASDAIKFILKSDLGKNGTIVAGASAGGAIAGQVADSLVEGRMLYYPVVDSICANIIHKPILLLIGTKDSYTPIEKADSFAKELRQQGTRLTYRTYPGLGHPLFRYREPLTPVFYDIRKETDKWLRNFCKNRTI